MKIQPIVFDAVYAGSELESYRGNPYILAQPKLPKNLSRLGDALECKPPPPTQAVRRKSQQYRLGELRHLRNIVHPYPEYRKAAYRINALARDVYVARNPMSREDELWRTAIATASLDDPIPVFENWKSSASAHLIIAPTGVGKTTFIKGVLMHQKQILRHTSFNGFALNRVQLVYVMLVIPPDGTLRALCLAFFEEIDRLLKTNYTVQAVRVGTMPRMAMYMAQVATSVSLGFIVVDEFQRCRSSRRSDEAKFVLNLFASIVDDMGVSLVTIGTPAVAKIFYHNVANTRKLTTSGVTNFAFMPRRSLEWYGFAEAVWTYTYTRNFNALGDGTREAWWDACAGNAAFAIVAFKLAQEEAILMDCEVSAVLFQKVAATDMAFLAPAIAAIKSRRKDKQSEFEDLILPMEYDAFIERNLLPDDEERGERSGIQHSSGAGEHIQGDNEPAPDFDEIAALQKTRSLRNISRNEELRMRSDGLSDSSEYSAPALPRIPRRPVSNG